jgi:hypothetical protein
MKFLNVYCEKRRATVYISIDKIVLVSANEDHTIIELEGTEPVEVNRPAEELVRMLNGENKTSIGFRAGR